MVVQTPNGPHIMDLSCLLTLVIFVFIFGLIIWEKIPRMYLAIFGAVAVIVLGVFDIQEAIAAVNWETIGFLLGIFLLIEILSESGFFRWLSLVLAKRLNYRPRKILVFFPALAFILAAFVDSITVMVFLTIVTLELGRLLKFDPLPLVVSEVVLANIGGSATLVGDPPNVILGTVLGFNFNDFVIHNGPIALAAGLAALAVSYLMNKNKFPVLASAADLGAIKDIQPQSQIKDTYLLKCGLTGMGFVLFFLIGRPLLDLFKIPIFVSTASLLPAFSILSFGGPRIQKYHFMRRIDSETIMFFIGLFIIIGALEKRFIIQAAANFLGSFFRTESGFISSIFWGSSLVSALVDNVPLAMAMTYIIKQGAAGHLVSGSGITVWATSLGVDLGGNLTPIGASANVVAYSSLQKNKVPAGWGRWLSLALPQGLAALLVAYLGILLKLHFKFF